MPFAPNPVTTEQLVNALTDLYGSEVNTPQVRSTADSLKVSYATACKRLKSYKSGKGKWNLTAQEIERAYEAPSAQPATEVSYVPQKDDTFVQFGNYAPLKKIVQSNRFYPVFITGLSGNGKTLSVEQVCAATNRELIRVNITIETDEDDLIGGFRLVNGDTVWHNGPVIEALERGAVLLLDEIDLASNKILCLQSILEGKGVFLKKIGKYINPKEGFNVIATANTKGKGSDDGRFVGTNVLNEAFLERFPVTFEQEYPSAAIETKILLNAGINQDFSEKLVRWAGVIRKTFFDGGVDEVITTRRLVHIADAYSIFGERISAIKYCINRFDEDTKQSFMDLYTKVDADEDME
ncbi:porphyrin biosynthetic protein [Synechococcus phage S-E7]|jgi:cobaltochelatase CobS|uniref:Porphyrin biosynthetic protein n=1 Tax=Synechococcus phage S-P4 TaxID=2484640 RepID=A0A3G3M5V3_9CAUD|nr:porphyrin biosynthesis [Synechococcus phage S-P4]AYR01882.1 porphyrin biosynthetic protein [Synechococcus phage S-P4]AYR02041.1 porphyrin biosynthetic protein [Synechococcus phage S-E7]